MHESTEDECAQARRFFFCSRLTTLVLGSDDRVYARALARVCGLAYQTTLMPSQHKAGRGGGAKKYAHEMRKFAQGTLHSGSKRGPVVHSVKQAKAIACHVSGACRGKKR